MAEAVFMETAVKTEKFSPTLFFHCKITKSHISLIANTKHTAILFAIIISADLLKTHLLVNKSDS